VTTGQLGSRLLHNSGGPARSKCHHVVQVADQDGRFQSLMDPGRRYPQTHHRNQVDKMLHASIRSAYDDERMLFKERAHERSVVFHIGRHRETRFATSTPCFLSSRLTAGFPVGVDRAAHRCCSYGAPAPDAE
jgi:hypothetical protein